MKAKDLIAKLDAAENQAKHLVEDRNISPVQAVEKYREQLNRHFKDFLEKDEEDTSALDKPYMERNLLVKNRLRNLSTLGVDVYYKVSDKYEGDNWMIWFVPDQQHDKLGAIKQMGWHIHKDDINPVPLDWIKEDIGSHEYDGHTDIEKYNRLNSLENRLLKAQDKENLSRETLSPIDIEPRLYKVVEAFRIEDRDDLIEALTKNPDSEEE